MNALVARFMKSVVLPVDPSGCWLWSGNTMWKGYGRFSIGRQTFRAHRVAYQLLVGPIPDGLQIDHRCRVRHCVNPDHLELVTNRENTLRGVGASAINARKTHCDKGHEFTPENTRIIRRTDGRTYRGCRECRRLHRQLIRSYT